jgi:hypothetical protein
MIFFLAFLSPEIIDYPAILSTFCRFETATRRRWTRMNSKMPMALLGIKYINPIRKMPKMAPGAAFDI